jgi:hypothetical protein
VPISVPIGHLVRHRRDLIAFLESSFWDIGNCCFSMQVPSRSISCLLAGNGRYETLSGQARHLVPFIIISLVERANKSASGWHETLLRVQSDLCVGHS